MEFIVQLLPGVVLCGVCFFVFLLSKHGWQWIKDQAKAKAATLEAKTVEDKAKLVAEIKAELAKGATPPITPPPA